MSLENEFVGVCSRFFKEEGSKGGNPDSIAQFFAKCVKNGARMQITTDVRYFIPILAAYKNGILCSLLEGSIDGISPMHYVPDLQIAPPSEMQTSNSARIPKNGRRAQHIPKSARTPELAELPELTLPQGPVKGTARLRVSKKRPVMTHRNPLPPLTETQDRVIQALYGAVTPNGIFTGKKMDEDALDVNVLPPSYPRHLVGREFMMFSKSGVVMVEGDHARVVDLDHFVEDMAHASTIEKHKLRHKYAYRMFYTWGTRLRESRFRKICKIFDRAHLVAYHGVQPLLDKIRSEFIAMAEQFTVYRSEFDAGSDEVDFEELQEVAAESIAEMKDTVRKMTRDTERKISDYFVQVNGEIVTIQLDFEEMHSLNSLPPSLQPFASDLKWKVPSLWRQGQREKQLVWERKIAQRRCDYIQTFFTKARAMYTGLSVLHCEQLMLNFLQRFSQKCSNKQRVVRIRSEFDLVEGIKTTPTKDTFMEWVQQTSSDIRNIFLNDKELIRRTVITYVRPEYEFECEDPREMLNRIRPLRARIDEVETSLLQVFSFFETEMHQYRGFLKNLVCEVKEAELFTDLRNVEQLEQSIKGLLKTNEELSKRPKTIFHKNKTNEDRVDFVIDLRPALEAATVHIRTGTLTFQKRVVHELRTSLYAEIQEMWAMMKDKQISKADCNDIETRMVRYSMMCDVTCTSWPEIVHELKASFDTIMHMYRALNVQSRFTRIAEIELFNKAGDKLGVPRVEPRPEENEYEYEEEEEASPN